MKTGLFTPGSVAVSVAVCMAWLYLGAQMDARERVVLQAERAASLCAPAPDEVSHTSLEPNGSMRCAVMRRGQLVTRLTVHP